MAWAPPFETKTGLDGVAVAYFTSRDGSGIDAWFKSGSSRVVLQVIMPWSQLVTFVRQAIGYAAPDTNNTMHRQLPWACQLMPWFFLDEIAGIRPLKVVGKDGPGGGPVAKWVICTCVFVSLPYDVLSDGAIEDEGDRFVQVFPGSRSQFLTGSRSETWTYAVDTPADYRGRPIQGPPPARLVTHIMLRIKWFHVAGGYLLSDNLVPSTILDRVGKVNQTTFFGYAPGEVLLMDPDLEPEIAPCSPGAIGAPGNVARMFNVTITLDCLKVPTNGGRGGHLSVPLPNDANGYWGEIQSNGATRYKLADLTKIFWKAGN